MGVPVIVEPIGGTGYRAIGAGGISPGGWHRLLSLEGHKAATSVPPESKSPKSLERAQAVARSRSAALSTTKRRLPR